VTGVLMGVVFDSSIELCLLGDFASESCTAGGSGRTVIGPFGFWVILRDVDSLDITC